MQTHIHTHILRWQEDLSKPLEDVCKHTVKHVCSPPLAAQQSVCMCVFLSVQAQNPIGNYSLYKSIKASQLS